MKTLVTAAALAFALTAAGTAGAAEAGSAQHAQAAAPAISTLKPVDSIPALTHPDSWSVVDDHSLIIWATPFDPYLVELYGPSPDLKWAQAIGVTSFGSRIYAKFDSVKVRGFSYPIRGIYKLSRADAKEWTRRTRDS